MIQQAFRRPYAVRGHVNLHHVHLKWSCYISGRTIHSTTSKWAAGSNHEQTEPHEDVDVRRRQNRRLEHQRFFGPRRQFMITSSGPNATRHKDILSQISNLFSGPEVSLKLPSYKGIVILATPSFAAWLENEQFISEILEFIFPGCEDSSCIDALLAVVDGLPAGSTLSNSANMTAEGFTFLPCTESRFLPGLWESQEVVSYGSGGQKPTLTFTMEEPEFGLHVDLPLANTLFRNGRSSTLLATKWRKQEQSSSQYVKETQIERNSQTIFNPEILSAWLTAEIPLTALTPPRRIVSGLGNIVRQIADADGLSISASKELEIAVDTRIQAMEVEKHNVAVWALVTPDEDSLSNSANGDISNTLITYLLFKQGASLHRVLSGGGGWGLKQGLLSLDPENTLADAVDARYDFDMPGSTDSGKLQALGSIAKPGSWVQFLTLPIRSDPSDEIVRDNPSQEVLALRGPGEVVLGSIPSSIDEIPQVTSVSIGGSSAARPKITIFPGHFGAQSENGLYVRSVSQRPASGKTIPIKTKIDVPFAHLCFVERRRPEQLRSS